MQKFFKCTTFLNRLPENTVVHFSSPLQWTLFNPFSGIKTGRDSPFLVLNFLNPPMQLRYKPSNADNTVGSAKRKIIAESNRSHKGRQETFSRLEVTVTVRKSFEWLFKRETSDTVALLPSPFGLLHFLRSETFLLTCINHSLRGSSFSNYPETKKKFQLRKTIFSENVLVWKPVVIQSFEFCQPPTSSHKELSARRVLLSEASSI